VILSVCVCVCVCVFEGLKDRNPKCVFKYECLPFLMGCRFLSFFGTVFKQKAYFVIFLFSYRNPKERERERERESLTSILGRNRREPERRDDAFKLFLSAVYFFVEQITQIFHVVYFLSRRDFKPRCQIYRLGGEKTRRAAILDFE